MTLELMIKKCQDSPTPILATVHNNNYYCSLKADERKCKYQQQKEEIVLETQFEDRTLSCYQCVKRYSK